MMHIFRSLDFLLPLSFLLCGVATASQEKQQNLPWLDARESGGLVYFLFDDAPRIERFDLEAAAWLRTIELDEAPTAFTVDEEALYISFGRRTSRFALDAAAELHLRNTASDVESLFVMGGFLYLSSGYSELLSVEKMSGEEIDSIDSFYNMQGIDIAPSIGKAFGRSVGVSPSDILVININSDGTFEGISDSPFHGDFPSASRVFVFPGEARVADNAGIVYNTSDLTFSNSLAGRFDDLAFYGDLPIVLRENKVFSYSNAFLETGNYELSEPSFKIEVRNDLVFSFYESDGELDVEIFSIDLLTPDEPGDPVDPNGLEYVIDAVAVGKDEVVYLLSRAHLSIFRWSLTLSAYMETIPLIEAPTHMAYSEKTHRLYLSYSSGAIHQIHLDDTPLAQTPFINSPQTPCGLATAGEYVFVCDPSGAWVSHFTYHPGGSLIDQREWNYFSREYVWSEANRRMYFFRDDTSPNDLHWEEIDTNGVLGEEGESPYHGEIRTVHPIRVAPDGSMVVIGSGEVLDALTLDRVNALANDIDDAIWKQDTLFTIREYEGGSQIQRWGRNFSIDATLELPGAPVRLFPYREGMLAITNELGIPDFSLWDREFNELGNTAILSLVDDRFLVRIDWTTSEGLKGQGIAQRLTRDTGYFWFFSRDNIEVVVKVLNACAINARYWVFAGGLTSVETEITVTDTTTGETRTYANPRDVPFAPVQDIDAFAGCSADGVSGSGSLAALADLLASQRRASRDSALQLSGNRFNVEVTWETPQGQSGTGQAVRLTRDAGYFYFFGPNNVEVVVKVLDGCAINDRFWVFAGGLTNVDVELRITDAATGDLRTYQNPQGIPFQPIQDTGAFATCSF